MDKGQVYTLPMTAINQLQMSYSPEEDRVLLRLNTTSAEEFRFWLTRRYCQLMVPALGAHRAAAPDVSNQVSPVSYTNLRAHETVLDLVCRLVLEKKKRQKIMCRHLMGISGI